MGMNESTKQILVAVAAASAATVVSVLLTHWLTKEATIKSIAKGETPLPPGSTPTTTVTPGGYTVQTQPKPFSPTAYEQAAALANMFQQHPVIVDEGAGT